MARGDFTNVSGLSGSIPKSENRCNCRRAAFLLMAIMLTNDPTKAPPKAPRSDQPIGVYTTRAQMPFIITP